MKHSSISYESEVDSMKYGLIGDRLGHSFSKEIHEKIADYTYDLIPLDKDECRVFMETKDFTAINVTIPYKKDVIAYLDEIDEHARTIGAVNTIVNKNGILKGYNTDFSGFLYMVRKHRVHMGNKKVLIIGNGGASAAIQAVVQHEQAGEMVIVTSRGKRGAITYDEVYHKHLDAQIIINTSPIGMYPDIDKTPLDISMFPMCETVMDIIYNPIRTKLCLDAKAQGLKYIGGLEMLIAQAKQSVEHFLNKQLDEAIIDEIYHDMLKERCNIILIGMPSAGKTTIGKMLEKHMQKTFLDLDDAIIEKAGMSIPEIFESMGEVGFRAIETEISMAAAKNSNYIIATGGGTVTHKINMDYLRLNGVVIFLDRDVQRLICSDLNRPLSKSQEALLQLYEERYPLYQQYAAYTAINNGDMNATVKEIEQAYKRILSTDND